MSDGAGGNVVDTVALCDEPDVEMLCDVEEEAADVELETEAEEEDECDLDFTCVAEEEEEPEIEWNCESDKMALGARVSVKKPIRLSSERPTNWNRTRTMLRSVSMRSLPVTNPKAKFLKPKLSDASWVANTKTDKAKGVNLKSVRPSGIAASRARRFTSTLSSRRRVSATIPSWP
jgi:hypothetical protein